MSRIVMKFGGTSVGSIDRIQNVSNIVKSVYDEGHEVVVVLSAMAGETDRLINLTKDISDDFSPEEYDVTCKDMKFSKIDNGWMLNCYPENVLHKTKELLAQIRDF